MSALKKSPRAPSFALDDAIERAFRIYEKERTHAVPTEVAAQGMGYSGARNGAALAAMATLRYYGLLERKDEGKLAISKELETYKFAPDESKRREILTGWVAKPPVFQELLEKYKEGLPSDATLKFDLIQQGFSPQAADSCVSVFRKSVEFSGYFAQGGQPSRSLGEAFKVDRAGEVEWELEPSAADLDGPFSSREAGRTTSSEFDRIPVRLSGGRKAWIEVPMPFYAADKTRLKSQIDLLLTDDEAEDDDMAK